MRPTVSKILQVFGYVLFILLVTACGSEGQSVAPANPVSPGLEILGIDEGQTTDTQVVQTKTFDQCASASTFKAQIQFSKSSSQENQSGLAIRTTAGLEAEIPLELRAKFEAAIEAYVKSTGIETNGHEETASIEVPAYTHQAYTIAWKEIRRQGSVRYVENGATKTANFSIRTGLELVSTTVKDLSCPNKPAPNNNVIESTQVPESPTIVVNTTEIAMATPTRTSTLMVDKPTNTLIPTSTPQPSSTNTPLPTNTLVPPTLTATLIPSPTPFPQTINMGEKFVIGDYEIVMQPYNGMHFLTDGFAVMFSFKSLKSDTIIAKWSVPEVLAFSNTGQQLKVIISNPSKVYSSQIVPNTEYPLYTWRCVAGGLDTDCPSILISFDPSDPAIEKIYVYLNVDSKNLPFQNLGWQISVPH